MGTKERGGCAVLVWCGQYGPPRLGARRDYRADSGGGRGRQCGDGHRPAGCRERLTGLDRLVQRGERRPGDWLRGDRCDAGYTENVSLQRERLTGRDRVCSGAGAGIFPAAVTRLLRM